MLAGSEDDALVKGRQSIRTPAVSSQNSESEMVLEGDDDTITSLEEKEIDNMAGKIICLSLHQPNASTKAPDINSHAHCGDLCWYNDELTRS